MSNRHNEPLSDLPAHIPTYEETLDFVENANIGLHWVGADGTILWANKTELAMLGYTASEYIGHHIAEFHADQAVIADILARLLRNESLHNYEAVLRCKNGHLRHVLISSNVYWKNGEFEHTRCITRDVTDRKVIQQALEESDARARALVGELAKSRDELQEKVRDLQTFHDAVVGRELKMMELEQEVARLRRELAGYR